MTNSKTRLEEIFKQHFTLSNPDDNIGMECQLKSRAMAVIDLTAEAFTVVNTTPVVTFELAE